MKLLPEYNKQIWVSH